MWVRNKLVVLTVPIAPIEVRLPASIAGIRTDIYIEVITA